VSVIETTGVRIVPLDSSPYTVSNDELASRDMIITAWWLHTDLTVKSRLDRILSGDDIEDIEVSPYSQQNSAAIFADLDVLRSTTYTTTFNIYMRRSAPAPDAVT
jgi:hypothetical protein